MSCFLDVALCSNGRAMKQLKEWQSSNRVINHDDDDNNNNNSSSSKRHLTKVYTRKE